MNVTQLFRPRESAGLDPDLRDIYARTAPEFNHLLDTHIKAANAARAALKWQRIVDAVVVIGLVIALAIVVGTGGNHVFAVPVDHDGAPIAPAMQLDKAPTATSAAIENRMVECAKAMFSVSPDNVVNRQRMAESYACAAGAAHTFLDGYFATASPFQLGRGETVEVSKVRIEGPTGQTYHYTWKATTRDLSGKVLSETYPGASFMAGTIGGNRDASSIIDNPFGIVFTNIVLDTPLATPGPATPAKPGGQL